MPDRSSLDLHRDQLLEIARLAHLLANTSPHKIPLIELRKVLKIEGVNVGNLTLTEKKEEPLPLMSRLAIQEIQRRFVAEA